MARNEALGRCERGTAPLPYVLFLVGKGIHSDFVLKCLEPQSSCQNLMICYPKKDGFQGGPK